MNPRNKIKIFFPALAAFFLTAANARAFSLVDLLGGGGDLIGGLFGKVINLLAYGILTLIGSLIGIIAAAANKILALNFQVLTHPTVQIGWTISRDIANLGFVLILILIALATVLRFQSYGSQKLLVKLIAAAIIINFSLAIAGFILDFTNVLAGFFISKGFGSFGDIATGLAAKFQPQAFLDIFSGDLGGSSGIDFAIQSFIGLVTGSIFSLLILIIMVCFMILFVIRFVFLAFLLILAPIAWLMWILPSTASLYKKWWTKFLQWAFFAPACLFFLYLAMIGVSQSGPAGNSGGANPGQAQGSAGGTNLTAQISDSAAGSSENFAGEAGDTFGGIFSNAFDSIINIFIFGGLMVGGLLTAGKFGLEGAGAVIKAGTAASKAAGKWGLKHPAMGFGGLAAKTSDKLGTRGFGGAINKYTGLKYAVGGARSVKTVAAKAKEKVAAGGETKFGKAVFGRDSLLGSTWAAAKKESGLFKKSEKKEGLEKDLGTLYGRQKSLADQLDKIQKRVGEGANLSPTEISNQLRLKEALAKVVQEIEAKEKDLEGVLGSMGGTVSKEFRSLIQEISAFEKQVGVGEEAEKQKENIRKLKIRLSQAVSGGLTEEGIGIVRDDFEKAKKGERIEASGSDPVPEGRGISTDTSKKSFEEAKRSAERNQRTI